MSERDTGNSMDFWTKGWLVLDDLWERLHHCHWDTDVGVQHTSAKKCLCWCSSQQAGARPKEGR